MTADTATDLQGLFEARSSGDFLNADKLEETIALCLSGGGYRAMIYHVGVLMRLNELGLLPRLREIASVSGGSITAGFSPTHGRIFASPAADAPPISRSSWPRR